MSRVAAAVLLIVGVASRAYGLCGDGGQVCFVPVANSSFDVYTSNPTEAQQTWMVSRYARMLVYSPYFDSRLSWYPAGWVYKDVYAIYKGSALATQHPEWILRDQSGNKLYIPYGCSGNSCPQYAGDVGNPAFRANWIAEAAATMAAGYAGLFEDDFNMRMQVGDGRGRLVTPRDPRTGAPMTVSDWRSYLAQFQLEIRAAFPTTELIQNQVFFFAPADDPAVVSSTRNANYVWIERGFNDTGIVGGTGTYGFETLLGFIDAAHRAGAGVVVEPGSATWGRDYALATYFLFSNGNDGFSSRNGGLPDDWWPGYEVDLGTPLNDRYRWGSLFRRDFARGLVLVNQPNSATVTVDLGGDYVGLDGAVYTSVTLGATNGIVLLSGAPATTTTTTDAPTTTTASTTTFTTTSTSASSSTSTTETSLTTTLPDPTTTTSTTSSTSTEAPPTTTTSTSTLPTTTSSSTTTTDTSSTTTTLPVPTTTTSSTTSTSTVAPSTTTTSTSTLPTTTSSSTTTTDTTSTTTTLPVPTTTTSSTTSTSTAAPSTTTTSTSTLPTTTSSSTTTTDTTSTTTTLPVPTTTTSSTTSTSAAAPSTTTTSTSTPPTTSTSSTTTSTTTRKTTTTKRRGRR